MRIISFREFSYIIGILAGKIQAAHVLQHDLQINMLSVKEIRNQLSRSMFRQNQESQFPARPRLSRLYSDKFYPSVVI